MIFDMAKLHAQREEAKKEGRCMPKPFGCGSPVDLASFRSDTTKAEYGISGLCEDCQDIAFSEDE